MHAVNDMICKVKRMSPLQVETCRPSTICKHSISDATLEGYSAWLYFSCFYTRRTFCNTSSSGYFIRMQNSSRNKNHLNVFVHLTHATGTLSTASCACKYMQFDVMDSMMVFLFKKACDSLWTALSICTLYMSGKMSHAVCRCSLEWGWQAKREKPILSEIIFWVNTTSQRLLNFTFPSMWDTMH